MAGRPLRRERVARNNPVVRNLPPTGYTWMDEDTGTNMDENYEIAMSEDGVYAYKIIGRVMEEGSPQSKEMWKLAGGQRLSSAVLNRFVTLPEDFFPETTLIGVGYEIGVGWNGVYNVYLLNEEDVSMRSLAKGIPTAGAAELLAKQALAAAQTPRVVSNPGRWSRRNPGSSVLGVWFRPMSDASRGQSVRGSLFEYVDVVPGQGEKVTVKFDSREALGPATASFWGPEGAESALEQNGFSRSWSVHKYGQYFAGQGDTQKAMSRQELESRGAVFIPASRMEKLR